MCIIARVLGATYVCYCPGVCKMFKKYTPKAQWIRLVSVLVGLLFGMRISLILKIQSISIYESLCENSCLLDEAKCHTVWKMIVSFVSSRIFNVFFWFTTFCQNCIGSKRLSDHNLTSQMTKPLTNKTVFFSNVFPVWWHTELYNSCNLSRRIRSNGDSGAKQITTPT